MVKIGNIELPDFPFLLAPMEDVSDPPFQMVQITRRRLNVFRIYFF